MELLWLLCAHYIGDYGLQSEYQATMKGKDWYVMTAHCAVWTGCICIALQFVSTLTGQGNIQGWEFIFLFATHFATDKWKCWRNKNPRHYDIYIDQLAHLGQIGLVYFI